MISLVPILFLITLNSISSCLSLMRCISTLLLVSLCVLQSNLALAQSSSSLLSQGWNELVKDNDTAALRLFQRAFETASREHNTAQKAKALLYLGFASYGVSYGNGLQYGLKAMEEYKKLEGSDAAKALEGRSRCLQLMSTINSRQGKYEEAMRLSREAMKGFAGGKETTGTLGLIYNSLGNAFEHLNRNDSAAYYYRLGLNEMTRSKKVDYLPNAYCKMARMELMNGNKKESLILFQNALSIAGSSENKQAVVSCLLGLSDWSLSERNEEKAESYLSEAKKVAHGLSDKSFYLKVLGQLVALKKSQGKFQETVLLQEEMNKVNDTLNTWEKQRIVKSLEVQFDVLEKDKKIKLIQQQNELSRLTNLFLISFIVFISLLAIAVVVFLRRINDRNKQLLKTKEAFGQLAEEQKRLKEQQMQNEIEFKESQLSAMTLQMLQKNELMSELKAKYEEVSNTNRDIGVEKIINKAMNQEKDWGDFNSHFESMNRNFYSRLKEDYPEISPNDLKICALIKLNLSIKEMAGILNISPDSVKTARYRLRKKLGLHTEDNLTDFILNL